MYFPVGWPKVLNINNVNNCSIRQLVCNRDKILFAVLSDDCVFIYHCKPCLPLVSHRRHRRSLDEQGMNELVEWKPDSSALIVITSGGVILLYRVVCDSANKGAYEQIDPPQPNLRRDSAELFIKQVIPTIYLTPVKEISVGYGITSISCIRDELMIATTQCQILRYKWDMTLNRDYCVELNRVPFCLDQQASKAIPIVEQNTYVIDMDYSPLIGGFSIVLNDGRSAFLTAYSLKFDPNQMQGIWAPNIDDGTCSSVNHKFRLITFGRRNSQCVVYSVEETTGALVVSHKLAIPGQVYPGPIGAVNCMRWSPDACTLAVAWSTGGLSLWSTFGALLMCSLSWDYGLNTDLALNNPLNIHGMEWSAEGYQLWMIKRPVNLQFLEHSPDSVVQLNFVKSALTVNPCMSHQNHLYLQGEDKLYVNLGVGLSQVWNSLGKSNCGRDSPLACTSALVDSKQWIVVQIPSAYSATNWPIRYTAINHDGDKLAVAGHAGLAHYSLTTHKWKLFGNETQEKDMLVTGGLLWWNEYIIAGCYNIPNQQDELRLYPSHLRLCNSHMTLLKLNSQVLLLDCLKDNILIFCADGHITIYCMVEKHINDSGENVELTCIQAIDMSALCVHPACFVALTLTSLRIEPSRMTFSQKNNFVINVSGRLLMVNQQDDHTQSQILQAPTVLASCVENVWSPRNFCKNKPHLTEALWLYCGAHGMRVWLPLFPRHGDNAHTFMSKRIMLPFQLKIYPLAILFEDAILLGAENDTLLYTSDANSPFSLPFCVLERTSQVYLHHILRQLIRRNLGFHAWEIARCCTSLPYFPHSLELLLHEVLEEEATSKDPIPDAQLPSVVEFIQEFPVYLDTVVQCARKTEIALWPYLFSVAGKPTQLFQKCIAANQLETAASYLIILQNLESSSVSRQYATMLLDSTLNSSKWELSKDLVRFLKAIDPNDVECSRVPIVVPSKIPHTPPVNGNEEDLSLVLGTMHVARGRSFSTTTTPKILNMERNASRTSVTDLNLLKRKKSVPAVKSDSVDSTKSAEEFFMDVMIERHARRLLSQHRLHDLGCMAVNLDFPLVRWLARERNRAAVIDHCVSALKNLHADFSWPYPMISNGSVTPPPERRNSMETLHPISNVGDSGYMSYEGQMLGPCFSEQMFSLNQTDNISLSSETESWIYNEDTESISSHQMNSNSPWGEIPSPQILDYLSKQITTKGSPKADIQLRYLLQLLMDAGCLQWALLISVLLRDAMAVYRITNAARSQDQSFEAVLRLKENIISLCQWSYNDCIGYKPFMVVIQGQVTTLNDILEVKQKANCSTPDFRNCRSSSISCSLEKINMNPDHQPTNDELYIQKRHSNSPTPSITVHLKEHTTCLIM